MHKLDESLNRVRYHLRATITPERHELEEQALWRVLKAGRFDEVMFFVPHAEERSDGLGSNEDNDKMVAILAPLFQRLRNAGIAPSINMWWSVAFSEFLGMPRDLRERFNFRWAVGVDGRVSRSAACLRCPAWRAQVADMYKKYASLKPVRLWIDDDVRTTLRADLHSPCFCPVCLESIQARTGKLMTPGELMAAIMADPPNPIRDAWLADQGALLEDVIGLLANAVHEISPETSVSLMHSCPEQHSAEGRCWENLARRLGNPAPMFRPGIGSYNENTGPEFAAFLTHTSRSMAAYPKDIVVAPEIETYPHSRFGKSLSGVAANLALAQLFGAREMTFSIYRFGGRMDLEIERENVWGGLLASLKPKLQSLADLEIKLLQHKGVGLIWREDEARHARGVQDRTKPIFLYRHHPWDHVLPLLGIPVTYAEAKVTALAGEQPAGLSKGEIQKLASGGLLLDARAAETLLMMGFGDLVGISKRLPDSVAASETIEDAAFGGIQGDVINCRWTSMPWQFELLPGAQVVSRFRGYRGEDRGHGVLVYENSLGGRVVIVPFDSQVDQVSALGVAHPPFESPSFLSRPRQAQLRDALIWAGRAPLPFYVEDAPMALPMIIEQQNRVIVAITNLMPDHLDKVVARLYLPGFYPSQARRLSPRGSWRRFPRVKIEHLKENDCLRLRLPFSLAYLETGVYLLER